MTARGNDIKPGEFYKLTIMPAKLGSNPAKQKWLVTMVSLLLLRHLLLFLCHIYKKLISLLLYLHY